MRQFGLCQVIPGEVPHRKNEKHHDDDLLEDMSTADEEWIRRREKHSGERRRQCIGDAETEYMQWFSSITETQVLKPI